MLALRVVLFLGGLFLVGKTLLSAVTTFVLPRGIPDKLSRMVFLAMRQVFDFRARKMATYGERDRVMALYAPITLLILPVVWMALILIGYAAMFGAIGVGGVSKDLSTSGSSLLTLGFAELHTLPRALLAFSEAAIGLILIALLIAYLPTMYGAWSRREQQVAMLGVRAGSPPSAREMITRFHRLNRIDKLAELWPVWETWFVDIEESHTSLAALSFFRSPQADRSWVNSAGTIMDTAALWSSTLDVARDPQAELTLRAGYIAVRRIADFFRIPYDPDPNPTDPISIERTDFDWVYDQLAAEGIPLKSDRDQAWRDFRGWRINYDAALLGLARLTMAAPAPWSADLATPFPFPRERGSRRSHGR